MMFAALERLRNKYAATAAARAYAPETYSTEEPSSRPMPHLELSADMHMRWRPAPRLDSTEERSSRSMLSAAPLELCMHMRARRNPTCALNPQRSH